MSMRNKRILPRYLAQTSCSARAIGAENEPGEAHRNHAYRDLGVSVRRTVIIAKHWTALSRHFFVTLAGREPYGSYATVLGVLLLGLAAVVLILVYGLWVGEHWAWTLGIIVGIVDPLSNLVNLAFEPTRSIVGVVLNLLFLYILTRPRVKAYLGVRKPPSSDARAQA